MANGEILSRLKTGQYATSNALKRELISAHGYSFTDYTPIINAVTRGESAPELGRVLINDNAINTPVVLQIAGRKAEPVQSYVDFMYTRGVVMPILVNDAVFGMRHTDTRDGSIRRVILNKPDTPQKAQELEEYYQNARGGLLYSKSGQHYVMPGQGITFSFDTSLRIGEFNGVKNFRPSPMHAGGFTVKSAIEQGYVTPHETMKFEMKTYDHNGAVPMVINGRIYLVPVTRQKNYETRLSFSGSQQDLDLLHTLGIGIIPREIIEQLEIVPGKEDQVYPRRQFTDVKQNGII